MCRWWVDGADVTLAETAEITDTIEPSGSPFVPGQTVTVTATLVGVVPVSGGATLCAEWMDGSTARDDGDVDGDVSRGRRVSRRCRAPPVSPATCARGVVTAPTVEPSQEPAGVDVCGGDRL